MLHIGLCYYFAYILSPAVETQNPVEGVPPANGIHFWTCGQNKKNEKIEIRENVPLIWCLWSSVRRECRNCWNGPFKYDDYSRGSFITIKRRWKSHLTRWVLLQIIRGKCTLWVGKGKKDSLYISTRLRVFRQLWGYGDLTSNGIFPVQWPLRFYTDGASLSFSACGGTAYYLRLPSLLFVYERLQY